MAGWLETRAAKALAVGVLIGVSCVGVQVVAANPQWPTFSASDLRPCANEIGVAAQARISDYDQYLRRFCSAPSPGDRQQCADLARWRSEIVSDSLGWFMTANDGEGGVPFMSWFNDPSFRNEDVVRDMVSQTSEYPESAALRCVARMWVERYDGAAGGAAQTACAQTPDETLERFTASFEDERRRHPTPPESAGARAQFQYSYALGTRGLEIIESYRACLGRHYAPNHAALVGMRDQGRTGCLQLSVVQQCDPVYPGQD